MRRKRLWHSRPSPTPRLAAGLFIAASSLLMVTMATLLTTAGRVGAEGASVTHPLPRAELRIQAPGGRRVTLRVDIAATVPARARGLMFRRRLAPDEGMLLLWKKPRRVSIWMKNTYVPLDIVFIGPDWRIVRIHENARPLDPSLIPSRMPVLAVLEIRAGMADKLGLAPGLSLYLRSPGGK